MIQIPKEKIDARIDRINALLKEGDPEGAILELKILGGVILETIKIVTELTIKQKESLKAKYE